MKFMNFFFRKNKNPVLIKFFISYGILFIIPTIVISAVLLYWLISFNYLQSKNDFETNLDKISNVFGFNTEKLTEFSAQLFQMDWVIRLNMSSYDLGDSADIYAMIQRRREMNLFKSVNGFADEIILYLQRRNFVISSINYGNGDQFFKLGFRNQDMALEDWLEFVKNPGNDLYYQINKLDTYSLVRSGLLFAYEISYWENNPAISFMAFINANTIANLLAANLESDAIAFIFDSNNEIVATYEISYADTVDILPLPDLNGNFKNIKLNGTSYMAMEKPLANTKLTVCVARPAGTVLWRIYNIWILALPILTVLIITGFRFSWKMAKKNYKPLSDIIEIINDESPAEPADDEFNGIIKKIKSIADEKTELQKKLNKFLPAVQQRYLRKLFENDSSNGNETILNSLELIGLSMPLNLFCCMIVSFRHGNRDYDSVYSLFNELSDEKFKSYMVRNGEMIDVICNFETNEKYSAVCAQLSLNIKKSMLNIYVSIGGICRNVTMLPDSYRDVITTLNYRFLNGGNNIITFDEILNRRAQYFYYPPDAENHLVNYLKTGDINNANELFKNILDYNIKSSGIESEAVKYLIINIAMTLIKMKRDSDEYSGINLHKITNAETITEMQEMIINEFTRICRTEALNKIKSNINPENIYRYLEENYANKMLTIQMAAEKFNVSPGYFGRYFRDQTGNSFIEYINRKRIDKAKKLLIDKISIKTVVDLTGFTNDVTFRRVFEKYEGITPGEYRKQYGNVQ